MSMEELLEAAQAWAITRPHFSALVAFQFCRSTRGVSMCSVVHNAPRAMAADGHPGSRPASGFPAPPCVSHGQKTRVRGSMIQSHSTAIGPRPGAFPRPCVGRRRGAFSRTNRQS
jgi:hypothetical protein